MFLRNLEKKGRLALGVLELVVAPDMRSLRRPKQTVHPASMRRMKDANVNQKPVLKRVVRSDGVKFLTPLTWSSDGVGTDEQVAHLMADKNKECNVDSEGNESKQGSQERD